MKLTDLMDLNQTVDCKWVTAAPIRRSNLIPPCKLTLINQCILRVTRYELIYQHGRQKSVTQGFFATWTRYSLDNVEGIGAQDPVGLLRYIPYNLILSQIITGRWGPAVGTLPLAPPNVNSIPADLGVVPPVFETENCVASQCPEFYSKDTLMLSKAFYLRLLWLGLIVLLNPIISIGNLTKQYLKPCW
ncbi:hypothetical protein DSO57_1039719 [Entomophthora muscae]|nr:hypothetical protein DSO57_1039719 [Entomophthora muscae]